MIPRELSPVGDRVLFQALKRRGAHGVASKSKTVNYTSLWFQHYLVLGENPPAGAKQNPNHEGIIRWIETLSDSEYRLIDERLEGALCDLYPGRIRTRKRPLRFATADETHLLKMCGSELLETMSDWAPSRPMGGTELTLEGLRSRCPKIWSSVDLHINMPPTQREYNKPLVTWIHHDCNQSAVQWMHESEKIAQVDLFVFVSEWQRRRFVEHFAMPIERSVVLRNAIEASSDQRTWRPNRPARFAYTSTPFRGLNVLLDAWQSIDPAEAELHIWSSFKLYAQHAADQEYRSLFDQARAMPGVHYHGILPNRALRTALREIDYLVYPSTFPETSCLAVLDALTEGCRVICPELGALTETVGGLGRLYPVIADHHEHVKHVREVIADEMTQPIPKIAEKILHQQSEIARVYDWSVRVTEWQRQIDIVVGNYI